MRRNILWSLFVLVVMAVHVIAQQSVYFEYPVSVESYNPYSAHPFPRPLGASGDHSGEDIALPAGEPVVNVADGILVRYQSDGNWDIRLQQGRFGRKCGYGKLYAEIQYTLNRDLRVPIGPGAEKTSREFTMVYGHIVSETEGGESTGISVFKGERKPPEQLGPGVEIGFIAPNGSSPCGLDDINGDGEEHLHLGVVPYHTTGAIGGYSGVNGFCPAHLVIAASRVGVFEKPDGSGEGEWRGSISDSIYAKWWEHIELENYHSKLGRPHNNHWNKDRGTDFAHYWRNTYPNPPSEGVWVQDFVQPYRGTSINGGAISFFGDDGQTAIILNELMKPPRAFLVREGFWSFYKRHEGYKNLGVPRGDESELNQSIPGFGVAKARQEFEQGFLVWDGTKGEKGRIAAFNHNGSIKRIYSIRVIDAPRGAGTRIRVTTQPAGKVLADQSNTEIWHEGVFLGTTPVTLDGYEGFGYGMVARTPGQPDRPFEFSVGSNDITVEVPSTGAMPSADFTQDGTVGFADFFQFADRFGAVRGEANYDSRFDLNGDGSIGLDDFFQVADDFGMKSETPNKEIKVALPGGASIEMVWIEPGTFTMGSPSVEPGRYDAEGPQHQVTLTKGFYLGKYEITQGQWTAVMGTQPWSSQSNVQANPNNPAVYISWNDAQVFIHQLNQAAGDSLYRLPTEAEWEYACRAGTTTPWSFGDIESQPREYAWYGENSNYYAHAVGTKLPNPWGLYDMHGNVGEWVQDWYTGYSSSPQVDPKGVSSGSIHPIRGGNYYAPGGDLRSARRPGGDLPFRHETLGGRLLRTK